MKTCALTGFVSAVHEAIPRVHETGRFGSHKVFVSALWETMSIRRCSLDDFKARLIAAHRAQLLSLARADLVAAMPAAVVAASQIEPDRGVQFHFVIDPKARDAWA